METGARRGRPDQAARAGPSVVFPRITWCTNRSFSIARADSTTWIKIGHGPCTSERIEGLREGKTTCPGSNRTRPLSVAALPGFALMLSVGGMLRPEGKAEPGGGFNRVDDMKIVGPRFPPSPPKGGRVAYAVTACCSQAGSGPCS